ncbi:MAG TPA: glycosyl hydrolase family 28 protein [Candidatus Methylacidiphilales bacterium]|nr:glycosyl hydrolase family 28 protein [Candidatus Methylacidiphilales bacterium]
METLSSSPALKAAATTTALTHPHFYPAAVPRSTAFRASANGIALDVLHHPAADHASLECSGPLEIEIEILVQRDHPFGKTAIVRPLSRSITAEMKGSVVRFTIPQPENLQIEIEGLPLLYIYALPVAPETPTGPRVRRFESRKIHNVGLLVLKEGETCWIDAGAVMRGSIRSEHTAHVRIGGYGILDGSYWTELEGRRRKALVLDHCRNARVEGILMLGPSQWMLVLGACTDIAVEGVRQIAKEGSTDGIDICGSRRVRITGCCLHNGDDNIAIKAIRNRSGEDERVPLGFPDEDWKGTVEDVVVEKCSLYKINGGSSMEIGYETSTDHIRNIRFENIDVLAMHNFGSVFGIHNGDRACVENIVWNNIRVEHHYDKLIDFRVVKSRWNIDKERGSIGNITLSNINVLQTQHNGGYTVSMMSGINGQHIIDGIRISNFVLGGRVVRSADDLDLLTRHVHNLIFADAEN